MYTGLPNTAFQLQSILYHLFNQIRAMLVFFFKIRDILQTVFQSNLVRFFRLSFFEFLSILFKNHFPLIKHIAIMIFFFIRFIYDKRTVRNHFTKAIRLIYRQMAYSGNIFNRAFCRHSPESNNMRNMIYAIAFLYILNDLITTFIVKIHINIRHRNSLGIEKTLKEQIIFDRIQIGNSKTIGNCRSCRRTSPRPH